MKNNQAGFSLVELMVVVAIIGILATIAVPNFQRFQARAKQASAKTELSGIFTAQKAFFVEYQSYTPDLQLAGFVPDSIALDGSSGIDATEVGNISRIYGSTAGGIGTDGVGGGTVAATGNISEVNGGDALSYTEMGLTASSDYNGEEAYPANNIGCSLATATNLSPLGAVGRNAFVAASAGCPKGDGSYGEADELDTWLINDTRLMVNSFNGI